MPVFQYVGMNDKGRRVSGRMSAMDEAGLEQKLRTLGLYLVEAKPTKETQKSANGPVSGTRLPMALWRAKNRRRLLIESCTLLGFQLKVGIPLVQALEVASSDCDNPEFQRILVGVRLHLEAGEFFHEALGRYPGMFPLEFRCVVKAGEQSGQLPDGLEYMRDYLEWFDQLMAEIQQASLYPGIVMVVVGIFVLFLFSYIIPMFAKLLSSLRVDLPLLTRIFFSIGDFAKNTWWMWASALVTMLLLVFVGPRFSKRIALGLDQTKLKLPVFGELNQMLSISRLAHNLGIMYKAGIPLMQGLGLCRGLVGNEVISLAVGRVEQNLAGGDTVSESFRKEPVFPNILLRMLAMGEKSGNMDLALANVAEYYNQIIPRRIKKIMTMMEPALMLFLIGLVGAVALSIYLPIISMMNAIK